MAYVSLQNNVQEDEALWYAVGLTCTSYEGVLLLAIVIQAHWRRVKAQRYVIKYRAAAMTIRR